VIPPIAIPAGSYTLALIAPHYHAPAHGADAMTPFLDAFAAVPLLLAEADGAHHPGLLLRRMVSLAGFGVLGAFNWHRLSSRSLRQTSHRRHPHRRVIAATILDGWEIDELRRRGVQRPRHHPGSEGSSAPSGHCFSTAVLIPLMLGRDPR